MRASLPSVRAAFAIGTASLLAACAISGASVDPTLDARGGASSAGGGGTEQAGRAGAQARSGAGNDTALGGNGNGGNGNGGEVSGGGNGGTGNGGTSNGGSTSSGGAGNTGGIADGCPSTQPVQSSVCTAGGPTCSYGLGTAQCTCTASDRWSCTQAHDWSTCGDQAGFTDSNCPPRLPFDTAECSEVDTCHYCYENKCSGTAIAIGCNVKSHWYEVDGGMISYDHCSAQ